MLKEELIAPPIRGIMTVFGVINLISRGGRVTASGVASRPSARRHARDTLNIFLKDYTLLKSREGQKCNRIYKKDNQH